MSLGTLSDDDSEAEGGGDLSLDDCMSLIGFGRSQLRVIGVVGLLLTADAMEMLLLSFLGASVRCDFGTSKEEEALLTTGVFVGMMFGTYFVGLVADRVGRRVVLRVLATATFVLGVLCAFVTNYGSLLLLRGLLGFCLGGSTTGYAYVMEFLPTSSRGRWGVLIELFWTLGAFVQVFAAWLIYSYYQKPGAWRVLVVFTSLPIGVSAACLVLGAVPESPRFLAISGQHEAAYEVLEGLARVNGTSLPRGRTGVNLLGPGWDDTKRPGGGLVAALRTVFSPPLRRLTVLLWFLFTTNAFAYYNLVLLATSLAIESDNKANNDDQGFCDPVTKSPFRDSSEFLSIVVATIAELPGTLLAVWLVDKSGRKRTQSGFFFGAFLALSLALLFGGSPAVDTPLLFCARALITGSFAVTYLYTPEAYPTVIRATGFGLANAFSRIGGMAAPFVGEDLVERGERDLALFLIALASGLAALFALMLPLETSNMALADSLAEGGGGKDELARIRASSQEQDDNDDFHHESELSVI